MSKHRAGGLASESGQSLIELALALPFLLLIFLGVADLGRVFYYTSAITNAAREGAAYAAHTPSATDKDVERRVCVETGFLECPAVIPARLKVQRVKDTLLDGWTVKVSYDFDLISGYLVSAVFRSGPLRLQAASTFPTTQ